MKRKRSILTQVNTQHPRMKNIDDLLSEPDDFDNLPVDELERDPAIQRLTYQQKLFAINYCKAFNGTQAAIAAGYSEKGAHVRAHKLLNTPGVQLYILRRQQAMAAATAVTREWVLTELAEIVEEVRMAEEPDRNLQLKALDMINRLAGYYAPETQVNIQNNQVESIRIEIVQPNGTQDSSDTSISA
jgi:hypothetical protein